MRRVGARTVFAAEQDAKCNSVRRRHFPDEQTVNDVRDVRGKSFRCDILTAGWLLWIDDYQEARHSWLMQTLEWGRHKRFDGVKSAAYYCEVICRLREYVEPEEFVSVCGQRFSAYLESTR